MFKSPPLSTPAKSCLNLINNKWNSVNLCGLSSFSDKIFTGNIVPTFPLHNLCDDKCHFVISFQKMFNLINILIQIVSAEFYPLVFQLRVIFLLDWFAISESQSPQSSAVESIQTGNTWKRAPFSVGQLYRILYGFGS